MSYPLRNCHRCGKDFFSSYHEHICPECLHELGWEPTPYSNAEHIRNMSDEELAAEIVLLHTTCELCAKTEMCDEMCGTAVCVEGVTEWLKQPYKE